MGQWKPILLATLLVASSSCGRSVPDEGAGQPQQAPSVSRQASVVEKEAPAPQLAAEMKETELFDADGLYFPGEHITWGDFSVDYLSISSPRKGDSSPPEVELYMTTKSGAGTKFDCRNVTVAPDALRAECGVVRIEAEFLDGRGRFGDRSEIVPQETVVLTGTISIIDGEQALRSWETKFTYWAGD
jgi:hypothetical protein